eukprot:5779722-Lingulodinium_polyedra.AAC.1
MEVGGKNKKQLEEELARLEAEGDCAPSLLHREVVVCKFESMKDQSMVKLVIAMREYRLRGVVLDALVQCGLDYRQGAAPAGYLEEE